MNTQLKLTELNHRELSSVNGGTFQIFATAILLHVFSEAISNPLSHRNKLWAGYVDGKNGR